MIKGCKQAQHLYPISQFHLTFLFHFALFMVDKHSLHTLLFGVLETLKLHGDDAGETLLGNEVVFKLAIHLF